MNLKSIILFMLAVSFAGCTTTAMMYPVEGPLSKQTPLPVLKAKVDGIMGNSGNISLVMPDGEMCSGRWSSIAPTSTSFSTTSGTGSVTSGLSSAWATVYGSGFVTQNTPGVNKGEAMLVGDKGIVIQVEFYTGSGTANGTGVAKDNQGNVFKVLF
ncbi:MAG: hypothetical protein ABIE75_05470 [Candidatus Omnitrophota bacterium]